MKRKHVHYGVAVGADRIAAVGIGKALAGALTEASQRLAAGLHDPGHDDPDPIVSASREHVVAGAKRHGLRLSINLTVEGE